MKILSQNQGHVTGIHVGVGDAVAAGQVILTTELMKMITEIRTGKAGIISSIRISRGQQIEVGQVLFELDPTTSANDEDTRSPEKVASNPLLAELDERRHALSDAGRAARIKKRHKGGGRSARENLADLLDDGSFNELGGHALAAQRSAHSLDDLTEKSAADGVITGTGTINQTPVAAIIVDYTVMAGTQGFFHHKKIDRLLEIAKKRNLPVVIYPEGGGGRPNDIDAHAIAIAQLDVMTFANLARLRGQVPVVAVVHGYSFAGSAALAAMADVIIGTRTSSLGMGGPAMIEGGGLGSFHPSAVGPAQTHFDNGIYDVLCADEAQATAIARDTVSWLSGTIVETGDLAGDAAVAENLLPRDRKIVFDIHAIIDAIFDKASFQEIKGGFAPNLIAGMVRLQGMPCGVIANHSGYMGGAIDGLAAKKASDFLSLCNTHKIPVVSLIDTPGFMVGPDAENTGQVGPIGNFFIAGAKFNQPLVALVLRRAYGLGAMAMAGGSLHSSDATLSWPSGEFGAMGVEGAIRLGMRKELEAIEDEEERQQAFGRMVQNLYDRGKALNAASVFEIDDVIKPSETRARIVAILTSLKTAATDRH